MLSHINRWRGKLGVALLLLAIIPTIGWIRSIVVMDVLQFPSSQSTCEHLVSTDHAFVWGRLRKKDPRSIYPYPVWSTSEYRTLDSFLDQASLRPATRVMGFGSSELNQPAAPGAHTVWIIPYWAMTGPLMLLSFCLLNPSSASAPNPMRPSVPSRHGDRAC